MVRQAIDAGGWTLTATDARARGSQGSVRTHPNADSFKAPLRPGLGLKKKRQKTETGPQIAPNQRAAAVSSRGLLKTGVTTVSCTRVLVREPFANAWSSHKTVDTFTAISVA